MPGKGSKRAKLVPLKLFEWLLARRFILMSLVSPLRPSGLLDTDSLSDTDLEDLCMLETSSFVSETSSEIDCDSDVPAPMYETQSLKSLPSEPQSSQHNHRSSSSSSSESSEGPVFRAGDFAMTQASLDGFIVSDEEEDYEEEMNSSDRAFIASSGSSVANDSITMYRLLDRSQRWLPFDVEEETEISSE